MDAQAFGELLAPINASLNATASLCLLAGFRFIRQRRIDAHRKAMLGAFTASALFLVFYLTRSALTGTHEFAGEGAARVFYLTILFSHMVLAVVIVPMVLRALYLARAGRFTEHRRIARWTFPIWLYVSVTGLLVYVMLYHTHGSR